MIRLLTTITSIPVDVIAFIVRLCSVKLQTKENFYKFTKNRKFTEATKILKFGA